MLQGCTVGTSGLRVGRANARVSDVVAMSSPVS